MRITIEHTEPENKGWKATVEIGTDDVTIEKLLDMFCDCAVGAGYSSDLMKGVKFVSYELPLT